MCQLLMYSVNNYLNFCDYLDVSNIQQNLTQTELLFQELVRRRQRICQRDNWVQELIRFVKLTISPSSVSQFFLTLGKPKKGHLNVSIKARPGCGILSTQTSKPALHLLVLIIFGLYSFYSYKIYEQCYNFKTVIYKCKIKLLRFKF